MRYPPAIVSIPAALLFISASVLLALYIGAVRYEFPSEAVEAGELVVKLPEPMLEGRMSLEEAIYRRRSIRSYLKEPLTLQEVGQLLWAAQGVTYQEKGFRSAPSAGATYPLVIYLSVRAGGVEGLAPGIYMYEPLGHRLYLVKSGDFSVELAEAALDQRWVREAPVCIVVAANFERTVSVYGERGVRYVYMEAGHVGQNIYLQATALGLGTVAVGAFHDDEVKRIVGCPEDPIYLFPVGRKV